MSQNPKMAHIFLPGTMGSRSPPLAMLDPMISAPASPKPTASRLHTFSKAYSRILVSIWLPSLSVSSFLTVRLARGFSAMSCTRFTMRSMGMSTRSFASFEKSMAPRPRTMQMNTVRSMFRMACSWLSHRVLIRVRLIFGSSSA